MQAKDYDQAMSMYRQSCAVLNEYGASMLGTHQRLQFLDAFLKALGNMAQVMLRKADPDYVEVIKLTTEVRGDAAPASERVCVEQPDGRVRSSLRATPAVAGGG